MIAEPLSNARRTRVRPCTLVTLALTVAMMPMVAGCKRTAPPAPEKQTVTEGEAVMTDRFADPAARERRMKIVRASILGTHAKQVLMHKKSGKGDAAAFTAERLTDDDLAALVKAHERLAACDPDSVAAWAAGESATFDGLDAVDALLASGLVLTDDSPVNATHRALHEQAPEVDEAKAWALANLVQIALEIDRDGGILQDMMRVYLPLDLLNGPTVFGIEDDNRAFYAFASDITRACATGPYSTKRSDFRIIFRKIHNWSLKHRGIGPAEYADEVLARDDIKPIIPKIEAMPAQRILVIGHSFTMKVHWSTLAPMNEVAAAVFRKLNPKVEWGHMGHGGMSASQALAKFADDAARWKPDKVLIVAAYYNDKDYAALEELAKRFKDAGAQTIVFDSIYVQGAASIVKSNTNRLREVCDRAGVAVIPVADKLATHPDRADFLSMDGVHMRPSYHKFMAGELLKFLAGAKQR